MGGLIGRVGFDDADEGIGDGQDAKVEHADLLDYMTDMIDELRQMAEQSRLDQLAALLRQAVDEARIQHRLQQPGASERGDGG